MVLNNESQLVEQVEEARKAAVVAISCEWAQKDDMLDEPLGFAFSYQQACSHYLDLSADTTPFALDFVKEQLNLLLSDPQSRLVTHNYKSSYKVLQRWGVNTHALFFDTCIAAKLLGNNPSLTFAELIKHYLQNEVGNTEKILETKSSTLLSQSKNGIYAAKEAECIFLLYNRLAPLMQLYGIDHLFNQQEMPLLKILAEMELYGIALDLSVLEKCQLKSKTQQTTRANSFAYQSIQQLEQQLHPLTKRLHPRYEQLASTSGRLIISPQNSHIFAHPHIRTAFRARVNSYLLTATYQQIEWAVLAHLSNDPLLSKALFKGQDIDSQTAMFLFEIAHENIKVEQQKIAKMLNYGLLHGVSVKNLADKLELPRAEIKKLLDIHLQRLSTLHSFVDRVTANALELGWIETIGERRIRIHGRKQNCIENTPMNLVVQGSVGEIMKKAIVAVNHHLQEQDFKTAMLLQLNNEILFEVPEKERKQLQEVLKKKMENVVPLQVPLSVSLSWSKLSRQD